MSRLYTKLVRELVRSRWQFGAAAVTVMLGVGFFHGALVSYGNLGKSYALTYDRLAFGDVWVRMDSAPESLVRRVERIPGVEVATGRFVEEVRVGLRDRPVKQVMGRLISLPADRQPELNRVRVVEGSYFSPQGRREALLEISFARAHSYRVGEFIDPTILGEEIRFRVVGLVQSPEYIYSIQSEQYLVPTPSTFGVIFIPQRQAEALFGVGGTVNEICVSTEPGQREAVAARLEPLTDRYGGEEPVTREEQPSNKLLMMDLQGYRQMAVVFPVLFLTGTVLTTYTLLARMVQAQSPQIGVLRALGFGRRAVLYHFLGLALVPALVGGAFGIGLGYAFAWMITRLYVELINVPYMFFDAQPGVVLAAVAIAAAAGLIGALAPARAAAALPPAQAMSQQAMMVTSVPRGVRWLGGRLSLALKLPVRNLVRRPKRTVYSVLGIALGVSLMVVSFAMLDSVDHALVMFFEEMEQYDISAGFDAEQSGAVVSRIAAWPGVRRAEPTLDIAVDLERGQVKHSTLLSGISEDGRLRRLTDESGHPVMPRRGEVLLGAMLRKKLDVGEGDRVTLRYAQNRREFNITRTATIGPAIAQPIGSTAYMRMEDVQRLFADRLGMPQRAAGGVLIESDPDRAESIERRLDRMPWVAAVQTRADTYEQIQELMRFSRAFTGIMALFGVGLAFAVVFTGVSMNVLERTRELATLRTLGYGLRRIGWLSTVENLLLAAVGIALGLPLGRWLDIYLMSSFESESMSLEPIIYLQTYVICVVAAVVLTLVSQIPSLLQVRKMDLAAAIKEIGG